MDFKIIIYKINQQFCSNRLSEQFVNVDRRAL
jgi:hypothetical protein